MSGSAGGNLLKEILINLKSRFYVIAAALLALFLGALDTLVMGAAMPTIVADLGVMEWWSNESIIVSNTPSLHHSNSFKQFYYYRL